MRLKDFLNEEETDKFHQLQLELLEATNGNERLLIQGKIYELISIAQSRYNALLNGTNEPIRLKDLFTEEEDIKLQQLKEELLDAPNDKVRTLIMEQINEILDAAESRYNTLD
jgi:hypothetical protein